MQCLFAFLAAIRLKMAKGFGKEVKIKALSCNVLHNSSWFIPQLQTKWHKA
jgi:hypothetical protein